MEIPRTGSIASTKAMARAAVEGRLITFSFSEEWIISGYLIGMDDFHWVIVEMASNLKTNLIHKSVPHVVIGTSTLDTESEEFQRRAKEMGESFWGYCKKNYLGRTGDR
jgi:hypothetical protein